MIRKLKIPKIVSSLSEESDLIINDFLRANPVGVLATVDDKNLPHATPVYFGVDERFVITFTTKTETKKHRVLQHNNNVMLVVFDPETQATVQVIGEAEIIANLSDIKNAFDSTIAAAGRTSETGVPPIAKLYAGKYVAYQLIPRQIRMVIFAAPDPGGYDIYRTIEFEA